MDKQRFYDACERVKSLGRGNGGIGTLGEKTLHAVLKHYFEPDETGHEAAIGGYIADIQNEQGIIEIQTRQFNKLRNKLAAFLAQSEVTVVYPVARTKWLIWVNPETGEATKRRKSPKTGSPCEAFFELYRIKALLSNPRLHLRIVMLELEEYRILNGWSRDKKKGSTRCDRIPVEMDEVVCVDCADDYRRLIPASLGQRFTSKEYQKAAGVSLRTAQTALNVLHGIGTVKRAGRLGRQYLYERAQSATDL